MVDLRPAKLMHPAFGCSLQFAEADGDCHLSSAPLGIRCEHSLTIVYSHSELETLDASTLLKPRKAAAQARSRVTVDALVEATARILVREGFDKASTNHIAREAGVSIGSLYQYFPSKEALVVAVIERHKSEMMEILRRTLAAVSELPIEDAMIQLTRMMIEAHRVDPALHRVLVGEIPRTGRFVGVDSFDREAYTLIRNYFETRRGEMRQMDLDLATFICVTSAEALTHGAAVHAPEMLAAERVDAFTEEVSRLLIRYVQS